MIASVVPFSARGEVRAPVSKSWLQRMLILAAQCPEPVLIPLDAPCDDVLAVCGCLRALGAKMDFVSGAVRVCRDSLGVPRAPELSCGESGAAARFMLPLAASLNGARLTGSGRLPDRPLSELCAALEANGAVLSGTRLPLTVTGGMRGGIFTLPGGVTSQYVSGLLLSAPSRREDTRIRLTSPLKSAPYADLTINCMAAFGLTAERRGDTFLAPGGQTPRVPEDRVPEGDWSGAAFLFCLGALCGPVRVTGLDPRSKQGDKRILDILEAAGAEVVRYGDGAAVSRGRLRPVRVSVMDIPDALPVLAALCAHIPGESRLTDAGRLRAKESDRLAAGAAMVRGLGADAYVGGDDLIIRGCADLPGGSVDGAGDHRIVMAALVAASACKGESVITGWEAVSKSYPGFLDDIISLGGNSDVIRLRP